MYTYQDTYIYIYIHVHVNKYPISSMEFNDGHIPVRDSFEKAPAWGGMGGGGLGEIPYGYDSILDIG